VVRNRLLVALLLGALVFSACAQNAATPQATTTKEAQPIAAQVIQLRFWHGQSQPQHGNKVYSMAFMRSGECFPARSALLIANFEMNCEFRIEF
jgi:ABC-type glycerol-3-phosphate transport system substrate-binding protein